ncbi:MAG: DUF805 domain-containing protein [Asticcacaulis sp.]
MSKRNSLLIGLGEFVTPKGRLSRLPYFANGLGINIVSFVIGMIFVAVLMSLPDAGSPVSIALQVSLLALLVFLDYVWFCLVAKRLHDIGLTAWIGVIVWADTALLLVSIITEIVGQPLYLYADADLIEGIVKAVSLIFGLALLFTPGQKGENRYGKNPNYYLSPQKPHILEN